jgi:hypothetical protein
MLILLLIMKIVLPPRGGTTGIHPGGTKTLQREGGKFAGYLLQQRSQGIGLTMKEL